MEQLPRRRIAFLRQDLALVQARVAHLEHPVGVEGLARKMVERNAGHRFGQEVIDHQVRERLGEPIRRRQRLTDRAGYVGVELKAVRDFDGQDRTHLKTPCKSSATPNRQRSCRGLL